MKTATRVSIWLVLAAGLWAPAVACGSSMAPSGPPTATNLITITSAGVVNPKSIVVARGSQVTIFNNDSRPHDMESDPHPAHTDCPELELVGFLKAGERRTSGNLNIARTCGFHDHDDAGNQGLQGKLVIQ